MFYITCSADIFRVAVFGRDAEGITNINIQASPTSTSSAPKTLKQMHALSPTLQCGISIRGSVTSNTAAQKRARHAQAVEIRHTKRLQSKPQFTRLIAPLITAKAFPCSVSSLWRFALQYQTSPLSALCGCGPRERQLHGTRTNLAPSSPACRLGRGQPPAQPPRHAHPRDDGLHKVPKVSLMRGN